MCAHRSRKLRGVLGCLHFFDEIADSLRLFALFVRSSPEDCGTSQAFCTGMMKSPSVSGCLHFLCAPIPQTAGRLRLFALFLMKLPTVSGSLHFLCAPVPKIAGRLRLFAPPMMKIADSLRLFALHSRKLRGVSGFLHPRGEIADSLRLFAFCVRTAPENCGASWAVCTFLMKSLTVSGCLHFLCAPVPKIAGRLRLFAPA